MGQICDSCDATNDSGNLVCRNCGNMLDTSSPELESIEDEKRTSPFNSPNTSSPTNGVAATPVMGAQSLHSNQTVSNNVVGSQSSPPPSAMRSGPKASIQGLSGLFSFRNKPRKKTFWIIPISLVLVFVLIFIGVRGVVWFLASHSPASPQKTNTPSLSAPLPSGLGIVKASNGAYVGINDGVIHNNLFAPFDTRPGNGYEIDAAKAESQAISELQKGLKDDDTSPTAASNQGEVNDAEAKIYLANIRAVESGNGNYFSVVVAVDFFPSSTLGAERALQGVYTAQERFNNDPKNTVKIRILIANSAKYFVKQIAQQIVSIKQKENVVGVLGWQESSSSRDALKILADAQIPLLSQSASSDDLTNDTPSPYFFHIVPPNVVQARLAANFAINKLYKQNALIFYDCDDEYSRNIADDFETKFIQLGGKILTENGFPCKNTSAKGITFTSDLTDKKAFSKLINQALRDHPEVQTFYFAGVSLNDAAFFQEALPTTGQYADLPVITGDASYDAESDGAKKNAASGRWYLTSFAFPDEWSKLLPNQIPQEQALFFTNYSKNFDPNSTHISIPYDYDRAHPIAILSYDAADLLFMAIQNAINKKNSNNITSQDIDNILPTTTLQGISGYIAFNNNHDPKDKAIALLYVTSKGFGMYCVSGTFDPDLQSQISQQNICA